MSRTYRDRDFRRLRQLESEMNRFRTSVVNGSSYHASRKYAKLLQEYEHLASGAYHLCGEEADTPSLGHEPGAATADDMAVADDNTDYDELEELSSLRNDIDSLLNESPRFSKIEVPAEEAEHESIKH